MGIKVTLKAKNTAYEGRFALQFKRERRDIGNLLAELQKGKTLKSFFTAPVAAAVAKKLNEQSYIDRSEGVTATGEAFIDYPFFREEEKGIYALTIASFDYPGFNIQIATSMERKLSEVDAELTPVSIPAIFPENEFTFANERKEIGVMNSVELLSDGKAYVIQKEDSKITFDLSNRTYETDADYRMGDPLFESVAKYVKRVLSTGAKPLDLTDDLKILVKNIKDFPTKDLLDGCLGHETVDVVELNRVPFLIQDLKTATQYAYLCLYDLLMDGGYYSLSEMTEIVQNEIVTRPIIDPSLITSMTSIEISKDGFKQYLPQDLYDKLEYKLRVVDEYLGFDSIVKDISFAKTKDYEGLTRYIAEKISPSDVKSVYLVMGYAFAKTNDNRIVDCLRHLRTQFSKITIVCKKSKTSQREEPGLRETVSGMGIGILDKECLNQFFHDRYIIFERNDGAYATFLCTSEIGQIYRDGETKGTIWQIPTSDTVKAGKSLIQMIKE